MGLKVHNTNQKSRLPSSARRARVGQRVSHLESSRWIWVAFGALVAGTGASLYYLTRGTTFWFDEWTWVLYRRGNNVSTFLGDYNGHFSLIPIAIYRTLFATVGLNDYWVYRVMVIAAHLGVGTMIFVYARRRVGGLVALCAAAMILLLGAGWQDFIWPFQVAWLISLAAGLGALLMLDRADRRGNLLACLLLLVSLSSSSIGIVVTAGVAAELLWGRRRVSFAWIVLVPVIYYGVWWVVYEQPSRTAALSLIPRFVANASAAAFGALAGRGGNFSTSAPGSLLSWGRPLAAAGALLLIGRLIQMRKLPVRVLALLAMLVAFWLATAITRAWLINGAEAWASRYLYVSCVLLVLLGVELFRAVLAWPPRLLVCALALLSVVSGFTHLQDAAGGLRESAQSARADLSALEIGRHLIGSRYVAKDFPGTPFIFVLAGPYFAAARMGGTPADSPTQLAASPELAREIADRELISIHNAAPASVTSAPSLDPGLPAVEGHAGGSVTRRGDCISYRAPAGPSVNHYVLFRLPSRGLLLTTGAGTSVVGLRRFAANFTPVGTTGRPSSVTLRLEPDLSNRPWHVEIATRSGVKACTLR